MSPSLPHGWGTWGATHLSLSRDELLSVGIERAYSLLPLGWS